MLDDNWEIINGAPAHHIEQLNAANTINVLEALATLIIAHKEQQGIPLVPNEMALSELHRSGTLFLLLRPGAYRETDVVVRDGAGTVIYTPPPFAEVPKWMTEFFDELNHIWKNGDALDVAAFALWRINWVHPFKNGNGRTARCFCYACLCAHLGVILPGTTTVVDQIMFTRPDYEACLRIADQAAATIPQSRNLGPMKDYLNHLLQIQMSSI